MWPQAMPSYMISTHALREEGDQSPLPLRVSEVLILTTPTAKRATS